MINYSTRIQLFIKFKFLISTIYLQKISGHFTITDKIRDRLADKRTRRSDEVYSGSSQLLVFGERFRRFPIVPVRIHAHAHIHMAIKLRNLRCYVSSYMNSGRSSDMRVYKIFA